MNQLIQFKWNPGWGARRSIKAIRSLLEGNTEAYWKEKDTREWACLCACVRMACTMHVCKCFQSDWNFSHKLHSDPEWHLQLWRSKTIQSAHGNKLHFQVRNFFFAERLYTSKLVCLYNDWDCWIELYSLHWFGDGLFLSSTVTCTFS